MRLHLTAVLLLMVLSGCSVPGPSDCPIEWMEKGSGQIEYESCGTRLQFDESDSAIVVVQVNETHARRWEEFALQSYASNQDLASVHAAYAREATADDQATPLVLSNLVAGTIRVNQVIYLCGPPADVGLTYRHGGPLAWDGPRLNLQACR